MNNDTQNSKQYLNQFLIFELNYKKYAIELNSIQRITQIVEISTIPESYEHIAGVINYQGKIIPVVDLGSFLFSETLEIQLDDSFIIVKVHEHLVALWVKNVIGLTDCFIKDESDFDEMVSKFEHIKGVIECDGEIISLLDLAIMLNKNTIGKIKHHIEEEF